MAKARVTVVFEIIDTKLYMEEVFYDNDKAIKYIQKQYKKDPSKIWTSTRIDIFDSNDLIQTNLTSSST